MTSTIERDWGEEYSEIGDKGDVGFLDFDDDKSLSSFDLNESDPVVISTPFHFIAGKPQSAVIGEVSSDSIRIKNTTDESVELWSVRIFSSNPENSYALSTMKPPSADADEREIDAFVESDALEDRVLQPRQTLTIWLSCRPKEIGLHTSVVHFDVGSDKIERVVFLLADDKVSQALFSKKPYSRAPPRRKMFECDNYIAGARPSRPATLTSKFRLPQYAILKEIRELVEAKQTPDVIMKGLNTLNYSRFFSSLINIEEIHLELEIRAYDMESVCMKRRGSHFLSLEVPGLAERRPSLVQGDFVFVQLATGKLESSTSPPYQGYIHRVEADEILLRFDIKLHQSHMDNHFYNVRFTHNRVNLRRLYHAVQAAECLGPEFLFPFQSANRRVINSVPFQPLNPSLNREQIHSVEMILECKGFPPYVIHGPPGTGKTMTLVEAILQLYTTRRKARILVCAPSNSAADHVLEKLLAEDAVGVRPSEVFRLNATSRPHEDVKSDFIRFCFFDETTFRCPPLKALLRYRLIISTYMSAFLLHAEGIRKGHFSHIFLDEAGQASEPETMVPISTLSVKDTVVVLAGDPMQLGPVVYSSVAENDGLGKSYLERLFEFEYYEGDENYVTKLLRNYRSHPSILELPSKTFYKGELIACKDDDDSSIYDWAGLPNKTFPVLFVGIQGCDEREGSNPSWFNRIEASKAVDIIRKLLRSPDLSEGDIGVITPYRQQVLKIHNALESLEIPNIKVGSVEQFQGQERRIIIISTVRSTVRHNEFDRVYSLGFLSNFRRFNVAITRARSLLIIIGNPHIITKDPYWEKLLRHCVDNGSYQGCPLPQDIEKPNPEGVEWGEDPLKSSKEVEWREEATEQYNKEDDEYNTEASKQDPEWGECVQHPNEGEWLEDASKFNSDRNVSADSSARNDSSMEPLKSPEAEMKKNQTNNFDGAGHEEDSIQLKQIEWKGMTFAPTGWGD